MKKFLGIICLLYSGIIGYIWFNNKLKFFLAPNMQVYIKISLFINLCQEMLIQEQLLSLQKTQLSQQIKEIQYM